MDIQTSASEVDMMVKLFGTSGIRGSVWDKVSPELAIGLGQGIATLIDNRGIVIVGHDVRISSEMLEQATVSGLLAGGCDAIRLGTTMTPVLAFTTREIDGKAGIMITASHNPPSDNGMKFYDSKGMEYTPTEEEALEQLITDKKFQTVSWKKIGRANWVYDAMYKYVERALCDLPPITLNIKVVVDCANSAASQLTPLILSKLGCRVITLNTQLDGFFPGRQPEPIPENLQDLCNVVRECKADLGIAHDGDGDRLTVVDEKGRVLDNSRVIALFAKMTLKKHPGGRIVTTVDTSLCIDQVVTRAGGRLERTNLGKTHVALKKGSYVLAAEPWKIIDPEWGLWADGIYAAATLVVMLSEVNGSVTKLFSDIPDFPQKRFRVTCPEGLMVKVMTMVKENLLMEEDYSSIWDYDGIRINYNDGSWLLVRPSGTTPYIKVYVEAPTRERLGVLVDKANRNVKNSLHLAKD